MPLVNVGVQVGRFASAHGIQKVDEVDRFVIAAHERLQLIAMLVVDEGRVIIRHHHHTAVGSAENHSEESVLMRRLECTGFQSAHFED